MVQVKSPLKLSVTTKSQTGIFTLPDDVLLLIIGFMGVREILTLRKVRTSGICQPTTLASITLLNRQTSKRLYSMTKLRWVWSNAIKKHVIDKGLPVPAAEGIKATAVSAVDLESRAVHAAKFHENWYSDRPTPRKTIVFHDEHLSPTSERFPVRQVLFLPGRNGQYLATASKRAVTCWEVPLDGVDAYKVAEWHCEPHLCVEKLVVNEDPKSSATVACICGHLGSVAFASLAAPFAHFRRTIRSTYAELNVLTLDIFHGKLFPRTVLKSIRNVVFPLHTMRGEWIAFGDPLLIWPMTPGKASASPIRTRNLSVSLDA